MLAAVILDLSAGGPLSRLDAAVHALDLNRRWPGLLPVSSVLDHIGTRWFVLPPLLFLAVVLARRRRSWRPVVEVTAMAVATAVVVGALKVTTGRARPVTGDNDMFAYSWPVGQIFPSGHAANVAMATAGAVYLLSRHSRSEVPAVAAALLITAPVTLMSAVSVHLGYHWVSDLLAGAIVGLVTVSVVALMSAPQHRPRGNTPAPEHDGTPALEGACGGARRACTGSVWMGCSVLGVVPPAAAGTALA